MAGTLGLARVGVAAGALAAPAAMVRVFGGDAATARRVTWLTRMLAVRDAAIAVGAWRAQSPGWLLAGGVSDAVDAAVVLDAARRGRLGGPLPRLIAVGGAASGAVHVYAAVRARS